jgi:D-sedoheptulose 7-phosphate isomerase
MSDKVAGQLRRAVAAIEGLDGARIIEAANIIAAALSSGNKVLLCGNGGSAADCQHIAGEFIGRFKRERRAFPAISLTTDTSVLTALANDYGFESVFSRQIEALGKQGDVLLAFSTSGKSANIIMASETAGRLGLRVVGFTGSEGIMLEGLCDVCITAKTDDTPRIQEAHIVCAHIICGLVEDMLADVEQGL